MEGSPPIDNSHLTPGQLRFRMHAPDTNGLDESVSADVFARKILNLVGALSAADVSVNGKRRHQIVIAKLQSTSPTAIFEERIIDWKTPRFDTKSAVLALSRCASGIIEGKTEIVRQYGRCADFLGRLGGGAKKLFEYAELWVDDQQVYRVDGFLSERAKSVLENKPGEPEHEAGDEDFFNGVAFGSFDGTVKFADLRGSLPAIKLILSAGQKQIDCVCRDADIEKIRAALNRRVRIYGRAIYDGRTVLPRRIEVSEIEPIAVDADFSQWKGSFDPFEIADWEDDAT